MSDTPTNAHADKEADDEEIGNEETASSEHPHSPEPSGQEHHNATTQEDTASGGAPEP
jgi:hypothetical protein